MRSALVAYCLGIYLVSLLPELSHDLARLILACWLCLFLLALLSKRWGLMLATIGLAIGILWHWSWANTRLAQALPAQQEGIDVEVLGTVTGIPLGNVRGQRFDFLIMHGENLAAGSKLKLSYFAPIPADESVAKPFNPGDTWRLTVRLKQPHGYANPGQNNRQAYLFRNGFIATGYVRGPVDQQLRLKTGDQQLASDVISLSGWRFRLLTRLEGLLVNLRHPDLIVALVLGEKSQMSQQTWDLLSATGTNHLFVISGLHIGLLTLFSFQACAHMLRIIPPAINPLPAQWGAAVFAIWIAVGYSLVAGWSLPTQRASIMMLLLLSEILTRRRISTSHRYLAALAAVQTLDPLATTSPGFWLSFTAVGVLLFFSERNLGRVLPRQVESVGSKFWYSVLRPQWIVFIGLYLPLTLFFAQVSLVSPIANLLAIPFLGFGILPLLFLAMLCLPISDFVAGILLQWSDLMLHLLVGLLQLLAAEFVQFSPTPVPRFYLLFLVPGVILLLMPKETPYRILAIPLLLISFLYREELEWGRMRVYVFDVGQGLSVLVKTASHALLYDTGPSTDDGWSAGAMVIVPALRYLGVQKLDRIIVSHGDNDHAGGLSSISAAFPNAEVISSEMLDEDTVPCTARPQWKWEGVEFAMLYPVPGSRDTENALSDNNSSCVLQVSSRAFSLLLPGDIESSVEKQLAITLGDQLHSTVLVAPHHGSNTSSSYPFLKMVSPEISVFAAGYGNGFGHPAAIVEHRNLALGIDVINTAHWGMISFEQSERDQGLKITHHRHHHSGYWSWSGNPLDCRYC